MRSELSNKGLSMLSPYGIILVKCKGAGMRSKALLRPLRKKF
jgi:hypothetical protein